MSTTCAGQSGSAFLSLGPEGGAFSLCRTALKFYHHGLLVPRGMVLAPSINTGIPLESPSEMSQMLDHSTLGTLGHF